MILKTKDFQETCKTIALATDNTTANLELRVKDETLRMSVGNSEYYVSVKYTVEGASDFLAVVNAAAFLNLIGGLTSEDFDLSLDKNTVVIKAGKSKYKTPLIFNNDKMADLNVIKLENKMVEMPISVDILRSILNVNSKELVKIKNLTVSELSKYYYFTNDGCFTFTNGACLNSFTLEKPVKMLLSDRIVKLFKLFKEDALLSFGHDELSGSQMQTKAVFETENTYVAAVVVSDPKLLNTIVGPVNTTKNIINTQYDHSVVLSTNTLSAAVNRLMLFTKNSVDKANMLSIQVVVTLNNSEMSIADKLGNIEVVSVESGSVITSDYSMKLNLADLKLILDSCSNEHITMNCGNHASVVLRRGNINNLIPEGRQD